MKKNHIKTILFYVVLFGLILTTASFLFQGHKTEKLVLADVVDYFEADRVESFVIDNKYYITLKVIKVDESGNLLTNDKGEWQLEEKSYKLRSVAIFEEYCNEYVKTNANLKTYDIQPEASYPWWISFLPSIIVIVLLVGPPGTGNTLLAKAVAGEAGVPFNTISGSDFVEMYVGVGASRVRDLFDNARKSPAAIIFIDEIDAVGRQRGTGLGGGHDEREQTLNQLLVEMDGFGSHEGIVVIAATNRADVLDPALLRPGRFDRQITVNRPNLRGREDILKVHARNKPLEPGVDISRVAKITVGFTGADLANLLNEAALLAARRGKSLIGMDEIEDSLNKILMGPKKKTHVMSDAEKKNTAYHEAGHAMVGYLLKTDPVHLITIVPTGRGALGYTSFRPDADRYQKYKQEYKNEIAMTLGGRAAEEIIFGDITSGAYSDIQSATATAKRMVTLFGMSEKLGPRRFGSDQNEVFLGRDFSSNADYSESIAAVIDEEIHALIAEAYDTAKALLAANIDKLHFIADYLLAHEDMDGDQFKAVMETADVTVEMIEEIAAEKERASHAANEERARKAKEEAERRAREAELQGDFSENTPLSDSVEETKDSADPQ